MSTSTHPGPITDPRGEPLGDMLERLTRENKRLRRAIELIVNAGNTQAGMGGAPEVKISARGIKILQDLLDPHKYAENEPKH